MWAADGLGGYAFMLIAHFIVDTVLIVLIENEVFAKCKGFSLKALPPRNTELILDEDVIAEE